MRKSFEYEPFITRLNELSSSKNISINKALTECGFKDFVVNLRKGSVPSVDKFFIIADYFNIDIGWLLTGKGEMQKTAPLLSNVNPEESEHIKLYRQLEREQQIEILTRTKIYAEMRRKEPPKTAAEKPIAAKETIVRYIDEPAETVEMKVFDIAASAGLGNYLGDDSPYEMLAYDAGKVPYKADFGIRISGDSMEPLIPDESIVWIKAQPQIENGEIGIFILDGEAYCKKLNIDHGRKIVSLVSLNKAYPSKTVYGHQTLITVGKVLL